MSTCNTNADQSTSTIKTSFNIKPTVTHGEQINTNSNYSGKKFN